MNKSIIKVARGLEKADLVLKNGIILNVFTEEFLRGDVAVVDGVIAGIGEYSGDNDEDIVCAINKLKEIQGGYVIASGGRVVDALPLALAGLISIEKAEDVQNHIGKMVEIAKKMGGF